MLSIAKVWLESKTDNELLQGIETWLMQQKEVKMNELAGRMAEFVHDTDPYGYMEAYETAEDAINEIKYLLEVKPKVLIRYLADYIVNNMDNLYEVYEEDGEEYESDNYKESIRDAYDLIRDIEDCTKEVCY